MPDGVTGKTLSASDLTARDALYLQLNDSSYLVHLGKFVSHRLLEYGVYQRILKQKMDSLTDLSTPAQFQSELPGQFKSQKAAQFHRNNQLGKPERQQTFQHLLEIGFSVGTSATYSVSDLAIVKVNGKKITTPMPQTHNIYMLRRHNQVLHELQSSGFYSVPNLYWLEEDKLELNRWAKWLRDNPEIQSISRDFSSTRNRATVTNKLEELVYLLGAAGRSFHVIIVGTGVTNALIALKMLVSHGHTVTIVTSTPIYDARKCARRYEVENLGISRVPDRITPHSELILNNIVQFESLLRETALTISSQYNFLPNSL